MFVIVGLGNPGKKYDNTRHNAGFEVIDEIAKQNKCKIITCKHKALISNCILDEQKVILAKPQTYMNLSGESVRELTEYYRIDSRSQLLVLSDDIHMPLGQIRIRKQGSAGGHNGLKSVIEALGHQEFMRIRIGVGEHEYQELAEYVTGHFQPKEKPLIAEAVLIAVEAVRMIIQGRIEPAMNRFNVKNKEHSA
ncbi:MAG: aminoacyl-tRNA hydrolase [Lachnospiraceae bacterium]|jgi:PTH1 family peptidyl-tRNA hydrolase|nr:aminoacyl-tRNA hydrolase [Lachnospiraceae bacterium]